MKKLAILMLGFLFLGSPIAAFASPAGAHGSGDVLSMGKGVIEADENELADDDMDLDVEVSFSKDGDNIDFDKRVRFKGDGDLFNKAMLEMMAAHSAARNRNPTMAGISEPASALAAAPPSTATPAGNTVRLESILPRATLDEAPDEPAEGVLEEEETIFDFGKMAGIPAEFTNRPFFGITGAGRPWTLTSGMAELKRNRITNETMLHVDVAGLVLNDEASPDTGTNPSDSFSAVITCAGADGSFTSVRTAEFPASPDGNALHDEAVALPAQCLAPTVFITIPGSAPGPAESPVSDLGTTTLPSPGFITPLSPAAPAAVPDLGTAAPNIGTITTPDLGTITAPDLGTTAGTPGLGLADDRTETEVWIAVSGLIVEDTGLAAGSVAAGTEANRGISADFGLALEDREVAEVVSPAAIAPSLF